jgi:hypothetical protein
MLILSILPLTALIVYNKFLFIFAVAGGFVYCSAFYSELINAQTSTISFPTFKAMNF